MQKINPLLKLFGLVIIIICLGCTSTKEFKQFHLTLEHKGYINCTKYLQNKNESLLNVIHHKESIMLLELTDSYGEIDADKIHQKHRVPKRYSHQYELNIDNWLTYEFHLISNDKCECEIELNYIKSIEEKLSIIEALVMDTVKTNFIQTVGYSKFKNDYRLIIFGEEDTSENITIMNNDIIVPKKALDSQFDQYGFLITSTAIADEDLVYYNKSFLINLNKLEVLDEVEPMLLK